MGWTCWSPVQTAVGRVPCSGSSVGCGLFMEESCTDRSQSTCSISHRGKTTTTTTSTKFSSALYIYMVPITTNNHLSVFYTVKALDPQQLWFPVLCGLQALHVRGDPQRPGDLSGLSGGDGSERTHRFRPGGDPSHRPPALHHGPRGRSVRVRV